MKREERVEALLKLSACMIAVIVVEIVAVVLLSVQRDGSFMILLAVPIAKFFWFDSYLKSERKKIGSEK